ncbi:MAG: SiaB family protein kinase [Flavobacteriales bacterium]|nr:SiaB family protein kinase [Flavobacteriales bacterium]
MIDPEIIFHLHQNMVKEKIISAYQGEFSHQVITMMLKHAKREFERGKHDPVLVKRLYNVLVECMENILKHAKNIMIEDPIKEAPEGIILLGQNDDGYLVRIGNLITTEDAAVLKKQIEEVNGLDREGLKERYRQIITNGFVSEKGGAGLGLVDIAMRSGRKLEYAFHDYDMQSVFYILQVNITQSPED